jgi:predicted ABC-class ATPase
VEAGVTALLVDEDTCATNFMIRDKRMQMLVAPDKEPITPFITKVAHQFSLRIATACPTAVWLGARALGWFALACGWLLG